MNSSLRNFLKKNSHLSNNEIDTILPFFTEHHLSKNDYWLKEGDICRHLAYVVDGYLRVSGSTEDFDTTVHFVTPGTFSAALASFAHITPSIWSIQALTDCKLLVIERENHLKLINEYKNWLEVDNMLLVNAYTELENRVFSQYKLSAAQRFNILLEEKPNLFNAVPLKYIADYLGMKPETLSRLRKKQCNCNS